MDNKKRNVLIILAVLIVTLVSVASYAYFTASVSGNSNAYDTVITTGQMALMLNDGEQVGLNNSIPGDSIVKEFSVKNTGTVQSTYGVYFSELLNTFEDKNDLVYTLTSEGGCSGDNEKIVPSDESKMVSSCFINPNQTHNYTLTITFKNDGTNQDDNKGKKFKTKISVNEYKNYESEGNLASGPVFFDELWNSIAGDKSNIRKIIKSENAPLSDDNYIIVNDTERNLQQDYPIYMWYEDGTVYMYSKNDNVYLNMDCEAMFLGLTNLQEVDLSMFNSSKVNFMQQMFSRCNNILTIDLSSLDTSNVRYMNQMFSECSKLEKVTFGNIDTGSVENMSMMFLNCENLKKLDISTIDTHNVSNMSAMFLNCKSLDELVLIFNTPKLKDISSMLYGATGLKSIIFGDNFDVSLVEKNKGLGDLFRGLQSLERIKFGKNFNINIESISGFMANLTSLNTVWFENNFITPNVKDISNLFYGDSNLTSLIDLNKINTSYVENMSGMFDRCGKLTSLDLSSFNTSKVKDMSYMFYYCDSLSSLDLRNFNVSNVTNFSDMFAYSTNLKTIYASGDWNISENANTNAFFYKCESLIGGSGTTYDINHISKEYARIDDPTNSKPGYFTLKTN